MPISYIEITSGVTSRARQCSAVAAGKLVMPSNGHASIGLLDLATDTFSEVTTGITSRTRRGAFTVGTKVYMPSSSHGSCGVYDAAAGTFSEFTISRSVNWTVMTMVGSTIFMFVNFGSDLLVGRIDTSTNTYAEATHTVTGGPPDFAGIAEVGGILYLTRNASPTTFMGVYNTSTLSYSQTTAPTTGSTTLSPSRAVTAGSQAWFAIGSDAVPVPSGSLISGASAAYTGFTVGTKVWWLPVGTLYELDTATSTITTTSSFATNRTRITCQLVGDKAYFAHNSHASIGVVLDIPFPRPRGYRGIGLVRGSRG